MNTNRNIIYIYICIYIRCVVGPEIAQIARTETGQSHGQCLQSWIPQNVRFKMVNQQNSTTTIKSDCETFRILNAARLGYQAPKVITIHGHLA